MQIRHTSAIILIALSLVTGVLHAEPFIPTDDNQVLEQLPNAIADAPLLSLQADLKRTPADLNIALRLAQEQIEQARNIGDPRYLGRAEATLAPWWESQEPPIEVLVMRAILHQANHEFDLSIEDLTRAIKRDPSNVQAWLTRASVFQVRGDYARATSDCRQLAHLQQAFVAQVCLAEVASLDGHAEQAYQLLEKLAAQVATEPNSLRWIEGLLADVAERLGNITAAEQHYHAALAIGTPDMFLLTSYADYLLEQKRPEEVIRLLESHIGSDGALLRLALAASDIHHPNATLYKEDLQARFAASRLRGSNLHLREEARFRLELLHQPEAALPLAVANWAIQREPADTIILLDAASAAHRPDAAQPVLNWLQETNQQDKRMTR